MDLNVYVKMKKEGKSTTLCVPVRNAENVTTGICAALGFLKQNLESNNTIETITIEE
jgi:hypothetical protein